jgi:signal peptidase I
MSLLHRRSTPVPAGVTASASDAGSTSDAPVAPARPTRTRSRRHLLSRIGGTVLTAVMAIALVIFVSMTVLRISGGELLAIRTGSMAPMMEPGDLLISRDVDPRTVRRGDVITFRVPEVDNTLVTHRVTKVDEAGNTFTTKGDANDTDDPFTTTAKDVLGIRWFSIPRIGRLMVFLSSGLGTALLIGIPGAIYLGQTLADRRSLQRARAAMAVQSAQAAAEQPASEQPASPQPAPLQPAPAVAPSAPGPTSPFPPAPAATPPPFRAPVPPSGPAPPSLPPIPFAIATQDLPQWLARDIGGDWVLVCPVDAAVAATLRRPVRDHVATWG